MSADEGVEVAVAIAEALRAAHQVGLVHRDLKPRNVFLARQSGDTVVKLLDFGIARETRTQLVDGSSASERAASRPAPPLAGACLARRRYSGVAH